MMITDAVWPDASISRHALAVVIIDFAAIGALEQSAREDGWRLTWRKDRLLGSSRRNSPVESS